MPTSIYRNQDRDGYICSLFHPRPSVVWTLRAINTSLAGVRDQVSDDKLALIRIKWWKDSIDSIFTKNIGDTSSLISGQPELAALWHLRQEYPELSHIWLRKMIQARVSR